jgi:hypothetical protein
MFATSVLCAREAPCLDAISFSESSADKAVCVRDPDFGDVFCDELTTGKFTLKATVFSTVDLTDPAIVALLDPSTPVSLTIGDWEWDGTLGDDPKYVGGAKKAKLKIQHERCRETAQDEICKDVTHATISLSVTKKGLSVVISAKTGDTDVEEFETSPLASEHAEDPGNFTDTVPASIDIGNGTLAESVTLIVTGTTKIHTVLKGGDEFDLGNVKLKSVGILP